MRRGSEAIPASGKKAFRISDCPEWVVVVLLFLAGTGVRFLLASYTKVLTIYPDELRYYGIAQSLASGGGISVQNVPTDFQKILYSLVIAPAFLLRDPQNRMSALNLIHSAVMVSAIWPLWLIARRLGTSRSVRLLSCSAFLFLPDLCDTAVFMSETVFLPMALWIVYGYLRLFFEESPLKSETPDYTENGKRSLWISKSNTGTEKSTGSGLTISFFFLSALMGVSCYLLYLCKEVGILLPVSFFAAVLYDRVSPWLRSEKGFFRKSEPQKTPDSEKGVFSDEASSVLISLRSRRDSVLPVLLSFLLQGAVFLFCFLLMKATVFSGMGSSYNQTGTEVLALPGRLKLLLWSFPYYLAATLAAGGYFLFLIPLSAKQQKTGAARGLLNSLLLACLLTGLVVAYTITIREDFALSVPRTHLRYLCWIWPLLVLLCVDALARQIQTGDFFQKRSLFLLSALSLLSVWFFFRGAMDFSGQEQTMLNYLLLPSSNRLLAYRVLASALCAGGVIFLIRRPRLAAFSLGAVFLLLSLYGNVTETKEQRATHRIFEVQLDTGRKMSQLIAAHPDSTFLFVSGDWQFDLPEQIRDTYLMNRNVRTVPLEQLILLQDETGTDPSAGTLISDFFIWTHSFYTLDRVDYLCVSKTLPLTLPDESAEKLSVGGDLFEVWQLSEPERIPFLSVSAPVQLLFSAYRNESDFVQAQSFPLRSGAEEGDLLKGPALTLSKGRYTLTVQWNDEQDAPASAEVGTLLAEIQKDPSQTVEIPLISGQTEVSFPVEIKENFGQVLIRVRTTCANVTVHSVLLSPQSE